MDIKTATIDELETRRAAIAGEIDNPETDLNALETEARAIIDELNARREAETKRGELRAAVAAGAGETVQTIEKVEVKTMTNEEIRKSAEYLHAFARYIKTEDPAECRSLLTENASGSLPVPVMVDEIIRTAWETDGILSRVRKTYFKGNVKVAFELSADGAYVHTEGTTAPTEESLSFGIVTMVPANIKKWVRISDEAVAMGDEAFVRYIYDELTYQIAKKLAALIVGDIKGLDTEAGSTAPAAAKITEAPALTTIGNALAKLSDEAVNPVIIMNRATEANFLAAMAAGNFGFDPFRGLPIVYSSALSAYDTASNNEVYAIVGDLDGAQVNFPEGDGVVIKWDDLTEANADMVRVIGRQYAAHAVTASGRFTNIAKPAAVTT